MAIQQTCPKCRGQGQTIANPCRSCRGAGRVEKQNNISVKIPPGIDHQDQLRISGKGEAGSNGEYGDLIVEITLRRHDIFDRNGPNLLCDLPIDIITATLGGELDIPTLTGKVKLKIPAGTQSGQKFRLGGRGVTPLRSQRAGDLICQVKVETPVNLSNKQKDILRQFNEGIKNQDKHNPKSSRWFTLVKKFFKDGN